MSLNASSCAASITSSYDAGAIPGDYPADFAEAYHEYAEAGVIPGAESGGGDKSIIETFMRNAASSSQTITELAVTLSDYWSGVGLTPAEPNISSVNNAGTKVADFEAAITSSITTSDSQPYFEQFILNIEAVVKTIQWTITPPPPGSPFVSTIS